MVLRIWKGLKDLICIINDDVSRLTFILLCLLRLLGPMKENKRTFTLCFNWKCPSQSDKESNSWLLLCLSMGGVGKRVDYSPGHAPHIFCDSPHKVPRTICVLLPYGFQHHHLQWWCRTHQSCECVQWNRVNYHKTYFVRLFEELEIFRVVISQ